MSPEHEQAELLLRKAREDQIAMTALAESRRMADAPIGFHAQQAVEYRYGEVIDEPLDRTAAARLVDEVIAWAAREIRDAPGS